MASRSMAHRQLASRSLVVLPPTRSHQTAARTRRALNIAPHASFGPARAHVPTAAAAAAGGGATEIIFNPPASEASVYHTPLKFLPRNDPKRRAYATSLLRDAAAVAAAAFPTTRSSVSASASSSTATQTPTPPRPLPPALPSAKQGRYHLTPDDVAEMRRLRNEDPVRWSINALAEKFDCASVFVAVAAPTPRSHSNAVREQLESARERWGVRKTKARDERRKRRDMLYNGEL